MQRIYGTAFATQEELDAWLKQREEAEKRDHRRLGRELDLFSISDDYGQGLILWHPKGGIVRSEMERLLREELEKRGYSFVYTPHIAKRELWETSGHEDNYADSMYAPTSIEDEEYRLKPMNCPFHIGIYKSSPEVYRDLPQRYSEMGTVYRAELSGTLHGLMRVRGFTVDDAHLFVRPDQVHAEIADCLDFAIKVFETYGFDKVKFELSVRGGAENKGYLGSDEDWAAAEEQLARALEGTRDLLRTDRGRGGVLRAEDRHQDRGRHRPHLAAWARSSSISICRSGSSSNTPARTTRSIGR